MAFARGTQVEMEFDEDQFVGSGVYLFAAVLEYFLGLYVSMNSFSQLRVKTRQRKEILQTVATTGRTEDTALTTASRVDLERWPIAETLDREPYRFEFFQAVRLLMHMDPERQVVGASRNPADEAVRFGSHAPVAFPASQIQELERPAEGPVQHARQLHGADRPAGRACRCATANVIERLRANDRTLRDFFDIFNHRMISLFYQAWEKYRFTIRVRARRAGPVLAPPAGADRPGHSRPAEPPGCLRRFASVL